jgi:TrmH family RNA methyltransferase
VNLSALPVIESPANPTCKLLRSLQRRSTRQRERAFLLEGTRAVADALDAGVLPRLVVVRADWPEDRLPDLPAGVPVRVLSVGLFNDLAATEHPQGLLTIVPFPDLPVPSSPDLLTLVVDGVRDPGNLGTLLRSAAAGGVDQVLIAEGTVDPYNPKTVRAGMGAHMRLPIIHVDHEALTISLGRHEIIAVADANGARDYDRVDWTRPSALVIGGEAEGASGLSRDLATVMVRIPLVRGVESLNAGVAGSLLIFEAARQRRLAAQTPDSMADFRQRENR